MDSDSIAFYFIYAPKRGIVKENRRKSMSSAKRLSFIRLERKSSDPGICSGSPKHSPLQSPKGTFLSPRRSPSPRDVTGCELRTASGSPRTEVIKVRKIRRLYLSIDECVEVYEAKIDKMSCCVKELSISNSTEQHQKAFQYEIDIMRMLPPQNSHIVEYIGFQTSPEKIQLFMGMYNGTLFDLIKMRVQSKRKFTVKEICILSEQILLGMIVLHNKCAIHRDVKSSNIFFEGDCTNIAEFDHLYFVLGDFGESKILTTNKTATLKGTPSWTAPEVYERDEYSFPADMWSFGMVIYEMITLKFPYHGNNFPALSIQAGILPHIDNGDKHLYSSLITLWE